MGLNLIGLIPTGFFILCAADGAPCGLLEAAVLFSEECVEFGAFAASVAPVVKVTAMVSKLVTANACMMWRDI